MTEIEQITQHQEVEQATKDMSDRDRALFSLGYSLAARHSLQAMNATLTVFKNSVPHIFARPATVRR